MGPGPVMGVEDIMYCGASSCSTNTRQQHEAYENQSSLSSSGMLGRMGEGYGSPGLRLFDEGSLRLTTKWIQARQLRESFCHLSHPEIAKQGKSLKILETLKERDHKESPRRVCGLTKECLVLDESRAIGRMSPVQSRPQGGCGVSWNGGSHQELVGSLHPNHGTKMLEMGAPK
jgi:hypothetical protein